MHFLISVCKVTLKRSLGNIFRALQLYRYFAYYRKLVASKLWKLLVVSSKIPSICYELVTKKLRLSDLELWVAVYDVILCMICLGQLGFGNLNKIGNLRNETLLNEMGAYKPSTLSVKLRNKKSLRQTQIFHKDYTIKFIF